MSHRGRALLQSLSISTSPLIEVVQIVSMPGLKSANSVCSANEPKDCLSSLVNCLTRWGQQLSRKWFMEGSQSPLQNQLRFTLTDLFSSYATKTHCSCLSPQMEDTSISQSSVTMLARLLTYKTLVLTSLMWLELQQMFLAGA